MGHPAATTQMVGSICLHFGRLTQHPDVKQRPTAQACANVLLSLAKLGHSSAAATEVVDSVCLHFVRLTRHSDARQQPKAQKCANLLWALATMGLSATSEVVESVCWHCVHLTRHPDAKQQPTAQAVANLVWALAQLKHVPSHDVVTAIFCHFVALCRTPGSQPTSQNISNSLLACAELGLRVTPACIETLLQHFLKMHVSTVDYQHCCNVAWTLAVIGCLDLNTFSALLDKLTTKQDLLCQAHGRDRSPAQLITVEINQLYQAFASLEPAPGSKQMEAWVSLRSRLQALAPDSPTAKVVAPGQSEMQAALALQGVPYKAHVQRGRYRADVVLSPHNTNVGEVILMVERPGVHLIKVPSR